MTPAVAEALLKTSQAADDASERIDEVEQVRATYPHWRHSRTPMHHDPNGRIGATARLTAVVRRPSTRIAKGLVREGGGAKTVGSRRVVGVHIRMGCAGGTSVGTVDIRRRGEAAHAQHRVVIRFV